MEFFFWLFQLQIVDAFTHKKKKKLCMHLLRERKNQQVNIESTIFKWIYLDYTLWIDLFFLVASEY